MLQTIVNRIVRKSSPLFPPSPLIARHRGNRPRLGTTLTVETLEQRQLLAVVAGVSAAATEQAVPLYQELMTINSQGTATPFAGAGPTGYTPTQIRQAYGINQISFNGGAVTGNGAGTTIAIVDAYDDPDVASDLHQFDLAFGLPDPTLTKVNQTGGTTMPKANASWATEISLDVEWAHAIAPAANIMLVEANSSSFSDLLTAVNYARNAPGVVSVSMSWGGSEFSGETSYDSDFTTPAGHSGVAFFGASGDSGSPAEYPSASPNVIGVGGTTLDLTSSNNIASETTWSGSTGGLSAYEVQPAYQKGIVTQSSTQRATPDVSYDANPNTGFPVYDSYGTSSPWGQYGGTSDAAPQWAALVAIADQGRALAGEAALTGSQLSTDLYQLPSTDFNDITSGTSTGSPKLSASAGYDLVTGRGSPKANLIVGALVGSTTASPTVATSLTVSAPGSSAAGSPLSITVSALNSSGTAATGYTGTVHFSSSDVLAGLPANYTFTAADDGSHTFAGLTLETAGSQTISATDTVSSNLSSTATISVTAAAANHLVFTQQPTSVSAGGTINPAVTVKVEDQFNNVVTSDSSDQVTLSLGNNPSSGTLSGTTTVTVSGGVATFGNLGINLAGTGYTLVASSSSSGTTGAVSSSFNVTTSTVGTSTLIEGFETSTVYTVVGARTPSASISTSAAHDGTYGLLDSNGNDWIYRDDSAAQVKPGESVSVWLKFSGTADGRAYFGFGASSAGTLSLVAAPNTNQLILQSNSGFGFTDLASVNETFAANHWYRLEVDWGTGGSITGKVYDSNGTTLLQTVSTTNTSVSSGGIAFRATGSNKFWDTVTEAPLISNSSSGNALAHTVALGGALSTGGGQFTAPGIDTIAMTLAAAQNAHAVSTATVGVIAAMPASAAANAVGQGAVAAEPLTLEELLLDESALHSIAQARVKLA